MSQQTLVGGGVFTHKNLTDINSNFGELFSSPPVGALTDAHILVGDGADVAQDVAVTGDVAITNAGVTSIASGVTTRKLTSGVAAGYKVARVEMALDGGNPTSWATGLTSIIAATVTLKGSAAPGVGTSVLTSVINGTSLDVYAWKVTATGDCTLVASTGTETFYGIAIGT